MPGRKGGRGSGAGWVRGGGGARALFNCKSEGKLVGRWAGRAGAEAVRVRPVPS